MNMRRWLLAIFLLLAGCGTHPQKAVVPEKATIGRVAPTIDHGSRPYHRFGSRKERILAIADREWR